MNDFSKYYGFGYKSLENASKYDVQVTPFIKLDKGCLHLVPMRGGRTKSRVRRLFTKKVPDKSRYTKRKDTKTTTKVIDFTRVRGTTVPRAIRIRVLPTLHGILLLCTQSTQNKSVLNITVPSQLLNCYV